MLAFSTCLLTLSALLLGAVASPIAGPPIIPPQPPHPPANEVYITGINYAGTGCPAGSVAQTLASDGSNINIAFDKYVASVDAGNPSLKDSRKNCQLAIKLQYPPGWSLSIFSTEYRGFISLDDKVTATQRSDYWFAGETPTATFQSKWKGELVKDYKFTDKLVQDALVWSSCKGVPGTLNINTQIRVDNMANKKGSGMITTDVINHKVTHILGVQWRRCP